MNSFDARSTLSVGGRDYEIHRLGGPASHGCIRLHPANAATLFALVKQRGMGDTTIVVSGGHRSW